MIKIKLWIDDLREPPDSEWLWVTTSGAALAVVNNGVIIQEISFDHDLGGDDTAIRVANRIEELVYLGQMDMPIWRVHSANPVGRANLTRTMQSAERFAAARLAHNPGAHAVDGVRPSDSEEGRLQSDAEDNHGSESGQYEARQILQAPSPVSHWDGLPSGHILQCFLPRGCEEESRAVPHVRGNRRSVVPAARARRRVDHRPTRHVGLLSDDRL